MSSISAFVSKLLSSRKASTSKRDIRLEKALEAERRCRYREFPRINHSCMAREACAESKYITLARRVRCNMSGQERGRILSGSEEFRGRNC